MRIHNRKVIYYIIAISVLFLAICSRSSFCYPCNDWNDANSFFTMGKGLMNGQVLYRDLFEQKGPYLYLIYGVAYLLSHQTFMGVFLLEVAALAVFLYAVYRSITLYCKERTAILLLPLLAAGITSSKSFYWGGSAEEFCLPLLAVSMYALLQYFEKEYPALPSARMMFGNGVLAGVIALIKYTLLGFHLVWILLMFGAAIAQKNWRKAFSTCACFGLGMLCAAVPWLVYFSVNGALQDWYDCYIYVNIFMYGNIGGISIAQKVYDLAKILYWLILDNWMYFIWIILGVMYFLLRKEKGIFLRLGILLSAGVLFLGIYIGGANLPYYSLPLTVLAVPGLIAAGHILDRIKLNRGWVFATGLVVVAASVGAWKHSMNTDFMFADKDSFFLYELKAEVDQEENPTLLNYGCLDAGLYTVADIVPTCRFYHACNLDYPLMNAEQERYIKEGRTQFVLSDSAYPDCIWENYDLVKEVSYLHFGTEIQYYLFKRKST